MRLGKRTARLVREAAVAGFVNGASWAQSRTSRDGDFPGDSVIVANTQRTARDHRDLYPTLAKVESVDDAADAVLETMAADRVTVIKAIMAGRSPT